MKPFHLSNSLNHAFSRSLGRRESQNNPPDNKVEEKDGIHHQRFAVWRLAVDEEGCGSEGGPAEGGGDHHQPHSETHCPRTPDQDNPTHDHGHRQRQDAVSQHTQALEEGNVAPQQLGVERDDDGAKPDDDKNLQTELRRAELMSST